jgi:glycosyltransferase involved in cell wall biosynthesis
VRRVAYLSPLPPDSSGIADYSADLLPALARHLDLELFTARPEATDGSLRGAFPLRSYAEFAARDRERPYDTAIYQVGNSAEHHAPIFDAVLERPGLVVLHEAMLHHLVRDLNLWRTGRDGFVEAMRYCYGRTGRSMAPRLLLANDSPDIWSYPLFEGVVDAAAGLLVHNRATRDRVLASRPAARISLVPHLVTPHIAGADAAAGRRRLDALGIARGALVVASFGHLTRAKRLAVTLRAFARFRRARPDAVYLLVGEVSPAYTELAELLAGELGRGVVTTGRVDLDALHELMAACDVALNLRQPTGGETSGACLRLLALGRPVVVSDDGWFAEIPDGACAKVPPDRDEEALLVALLEALAGDEDLRRSLGRNAARWALERHRPADCARGYAEAVERTLADPMPRTLAVPPLARPWPGDMTTGLVTGLAAALGDLGLDETVTSIQRALAETLVDLDLDRAGRPQAGRAEP